MYLPTLEAHDPPPEAGRFGQAIRALRREGKAIPQIYHLFAWRPAAAKHLASFMQEVMRGPSPLSPGLRELVAAWTSARNRCVF
jgi:alkylhydroperoxidase family enzyme